MKTLLLCFFVSIPFQNLVQSWKLSWIDQAIVLSDSEVLVSQTDRLSLLKVNGKKIQKSLDWPSIHHIGSLSSMRVWASNRQYGISVFDKELSLVQHFPTGQKLPTVNSDLVMDASGFIWTLSLDGRELNRFNTNPIQQTFKLQLQSPAQALFSSKLGIVVVFENEMQLMHIEELKLIKISSKPLYNQKEIIQHSGNKELEDKGFSIFDRSKSRLLLQKADSLYFYSL